MATNSEGKPYTEQQEAAARHVVNLARQVSPHELLEVLSMAPEADIKKAFRKKALQFHPDKNSAPSAEEAFKSISKAFSILMRQDEFNFCDMFSSADLVPIVPTTTTVLVSATIAPTSATIAPTSAAIRAPSSSPIDTFTAGYKCPMCLGCGQFFETLDELKTHQMHRYNCTIYIADLRKRHGANGDESH